MDVGVDFLIFTLSFVSIHVCDIAGLQASSQTDLALRQNWFHD
jgi:hypothetical protein